MNTTAITANVQPTMSSLEIAGLVESRHDKVKQSIERLANRSVIQLPPLGEVKNHLGQMVSVYSVCKRDSYIVVAQLCPEFTARLVDRWQELEAVVSAPALPDFSNPVEAARAWADAKESEQKALAAAEAAKPALEFVNKYVSANSGNKGFRQVCKLLRANERHFRDFLESHGVMYKLGGEWMPYQKHVDAGRFVVKTGVNEDAGHSFNQAKFTPKGVNWIAGLWAVASLGGDAA